MIRFFSLCSHRQWRVCKWKCVVPLHCRPLSTMQPWHPNVWVISVFFTTTHSRKKKKSLHFRMFLMKPWQLWTLWKLDPWGQGVLISVYRNEVPIKAPVLHSQVRRWSWGKVLCNFFHRHRFYLTGSWHKIQLHRLEYLAAIFLKMNNCHFKENNWQYLPFMIKFELSSKYILEFKTPCICRWERDSFPIFNVFSDEIEGVLTNIFFPIVQWNGSAFVRAT